LAYIGPDQMLPVASAFAAAIGVVLMFWRFFLNMVTKPFRLVFRRSGGPGAAAVNDATVTAGKQQNL
jgi:hypothetical protein